MKLGTPSHSTHHRLTFSRSLLSKLRLRPDLSPILLVDSFNMELTTTEGRCCGESSFCTSFPWSPLIIKMRAALLAINSTSRSCYPSAMTHVLAKPNMFNFMLSQPKLFRSAPASANNVIISYFYICVNNLSIWFSADFMLLRPQRQKLTPLYHHHNPNHHLQPPHRQQHQSDLGPQILLI